jgi:DNA-binding CsgD family transcriptional regulator
VDDEIREPTMPQPSHLFSPTPSATAAAILESLPWPVWVCRGDAWVDFANEAARAGGAAGALDIRFGRLAARDAAGMARLDQALRGASGDGRPRVVDLEEAGDRRGVRLHVIAIAHISAWAGPWPGAAALLTSAAPALHTALERLAERFSLTQRETAVLGDLAQGLTVADIAARRHVQRVTVRAHLRSLFDKTDRRRQADLVRLVVGV